MGVLSPMPTDSSLPVLFWDGIYQLLISSAEQICPFPAFRTVELQTIFVTLEECKNWIAVTDVAAAVESLKYLIRVELGRGRRGRGRILLAK